MDLSNRKDHEDIKIWAIDECEWWIGSGTSESIFEAFLAHTQLSREDALRDGRGLPMALDDAALNDHTYYLAGADVLPGQTSRTFFQQRVIEIAKGGKFPRMFAVEDY